jgi:hypothetical protein
MKFDDHLEKEHVEEVRMALQSAFPATDKDTELQRDLWPVLLRRMETPAATVPWYDWVLAGALALALVFFPKIALLFAYHM